MAPKKPPALQMWGARLSATLHFTNPLLHNSWFIRRRKRFCAKYFDYVRFVSTKREPSSAVAKGFVRNISIMLDLLAQNLLLWRINLNIQITIAYHFCASKIITQRKGASSTQAFLTN
jgi:hypothetical protein